MEKKSGVIPFSMPLYKLCHQEKTDTLPNEISHILKLEIS